MKKLLIVVNEDRFFISHRFSIALAAMREGYDVTVATKDTGQLSEIQAAGIRTVDLPVDPVGMNPVQELKTLAFLINLYRRERPDIVLHVGIKNIVWGGLAAKLTNVHGCINAVAGLGSLFNGDSLSVVSRIVLRIISFNNRRKGVKVIFQNNDDKKIFLENRAVTESQTEYIKGSGIDLVDYSYVEEPSEGPVKIIFTARMVKEKGVTDLVDAAKILKPDYDGKVNFLLCGRLTKNSSAITSDYLLSNCDGEYISWLGERDDIKKMLGASHIMAFPSYYREGVPKSLIEACAVGRPIVTCDSVGCRDVVDDGINGFLVSPKSPESLASKLKELIDSKELRVNMGREARRKAEKEFSIEGVIETHMRLFNELLPTSSGVRS